MKKKVRPLQPRRHRAIGYEGLIKAKGAWAAAPHFTEDSTMDPTRCFAAALILVLMMVAAPSDAAGPSWDEAKVISEATGGRFNNRAGSYFDKDCNQDTPYQNDVVDLNGDGQPEVFVTIQGTCWGGMTGVHVDLLIKGADGKWTSQFGFPGIYQLLETKNKGYPDVEFGGPGFCFPIWRWNGQKYAIHKKCPT